MSHNTGSIRLTAFLVLLVWLQASSCLASIENKPVKVTHRNSGPSYDIDDVERTRVPAQPESNSINTNGDSSSSNNSNNNNNNNNDLHRIPLRNNDEPSSTDDMMSRPQLSIRRIFLVPVMSQPRDEQSGDGNLWSQGEKSSDEDNGQSRDPLRSILFGGGPSRPFWPFMPPPPPPSPATYHHKPHMFGEDDASRPMTPEESQERPALNGPEREESTSGNRQQFSPTATAAAGPNIDPFQLIMDLMRHALNPNAPMSPTTSNFFNDLSKDASSDRHQEETGETNSNNKTSTGITDQLERPVKPTSTNETKEDVVEIDGKKYLRKTIINRHVGENMIFLTKRLIFVPMNETEQDSGAAITTISSPSPVASGAESTQPITQSGANQPTELSTSPSVNAEEPERKIELESTTTSTTTTSATNPSPTNVVSDATTTQATTTEEPNVTPRAPIETTTTTGTSSSSVVEETTAKDAPNSKSWSNPEAANRANERLTATSDKVDSSTIRSTSA